MSIRFDKNAKRKGVTRRKSLEFQLGLVKTLTKKFADIDKHNLKTTELSLKGQDTQLLTLISASAMEISTSLKHQTKLKEAELKLNHTKAMIDLANQVMQFKIEMMKHNQQVKSDEANIISNLAKNSSSDCEPMEAMLKLFSGAFTKNDKCLKFFPNKTIDELNKLYVIDTGGDIIGLVQVMLEVTNGLNMYNK